MTTTANTTTEAQAVSDGVTTFNAICIHWGRILNPRNQHATAAKLADMLTTKRIADKIIDAVADRILRGENRHTVANDVARYFNSQMRTIAHRFTIHPSQLTSAISALALTATKEFPHDFPQHTTA